MLSLLLHETLLLCERIEFPIFNCQMMCCLNLRLANTQILHSHKPIFQQALYPGPLHRTSCLCGSGQTA